MSLFGGEASPSPHEPEESELEQSNPSKVDAADEQSAQPLQHLNQLSNLDAGSDIDAEGDTDSDAFEESQPSRPNRFVGPRQTWRGYTAGERQIAASLEQIENSDLAAHLYNTHALKRRARRSTTQTEGLKNWQNRDRWLRPDSELQYKDALGLPQKELVPSNDWTAWPLNPKKSCNFRGQSRKVPANARPDEWVIGDAGKQDAGEELRDEVLATFLRLAKDNWDTREEDSDPDDAHSINSRSRSRSRSRSAISRSSRRSTSRPDDAVRDSQNTAESTHSPTNAKIRGGTPKSASFTHPAILADDAQAQGLLQPTIHSMLSKLDDLALAIRRTRLNHIGFGGHDGLTSYSEYTTDAGTDRSRSKRRSKSTTKSRRKKASKSAKEVSESDVAMRSSSDSAQSLSTMHTRKRRRSASITSDDSAVSSRDQSGRVGLMDWSEVLGLAAIKGWDRGAIARTAQRCAALFGESMSFIPLKEDPDSNPVLERVQFTPSTIPVVLVPKSSVRKRPFFQVGTLRCPHVGCFGHEKDFPLSYRVVEHCMRVHGYDPRTNNSDNEKNKVGGVHMDGFLQPVTLKSGWLGLGRAKAKKKLKTGEANEPVAVEVTPNVED